MNVIGKVSDQPKGILALAALGVVAAVLIAGFLLKSTAEKILIAEAQRTSTAWANYIGAEFDRIEAVASGDPLTAEEAAFLSGVRVFGNIFRFKLFDKSGGLRLASDDLNTDVFRRMDSVKDHSDTAYRVVATGAVISEIKDGRAKPDRPDVYAETYVPVFRDGALVAVVEVYTDETDLRARVMNDFIWFGLGISLAILIGVSLPVSALIFMVRLVREKNRQLEAAERVKWDFFAHMNHELRTPLNSILGYTQMLASEPWGKIENDKYKEYINDIQLSGHHLLTLVNDILDMSKIESQQFTFDPEAFSVGDVTRNVVDMLTPQLGGKNISVEIGPAVDRVHLHADKHLFRQLLVNLIDNAIKFSRPDGTITIDAEVDAGDRAVISVTDTGVGVASDDLEKILEPFGQSRKSAHVSHEMGTGLGLSLCVRIMDLHGGVLTVDSTPDIGTTVNLTFPAERTVHARFAGGSRVVPLVPGSATDLARRHS